MTILLCPVWSSSSSFPCSLLGTMILIPHIKQPDSIVISNLRLKNGGNFASTSCGHPSLVYLKILDKTGSFAVSKCNCLGSTGSVPICWILNKHAERLFELLICCLVVVLTNYQHWHALLLDEIQYHSYMLTV